MKIVAGVQPYTLPRSEQSPNLTFVLFVCFAVTNRPADGFLLIIECFREALGVSFQSK